MLLYRNLKADYQFTDAEAELLHSLQPRMEQLADRFIGEFYDYIWGFGETAQFLRNKEIIAKHNSKIREWFVNLFCGQYDMQYFTNLYKIGEIHVKIGLPTHYVNSAFTFTRTFILQNVTEPFKDQKLHLQEVHAIEKIIDMNLDVLTSSYREEELGRFLSLSSFEKSILVGLKKFNSYVNLFLATALALVAFFAISLFGYDIYLLFSGKIEIEQGILTILGSLLVLWAAIELIHEEINHLQGKKFAISTFIMLAMAALIRKILIYSLSAEKAQELMAIGGVIVGLAIAYWLVGAKDKNSSL